MSEEKKNAIEQTIIALADTFDEELLGKQCHELEEYWFFVWDDKKSLEANIYEFNDILDLYKYHCERWERAHNGFVCIAERVRDKYLMPKIKEFANSVRGKLNN